MNELCKLRRQRRRRLFQLRATTEASRGLGGRGSDFRIELGVQLAKVLVFCLLVMKRKLVVLQAL